MPVSEVNSAGFRLLLLFTQFSFIPGMQLAVVITSKIHLSRETSRTRISALCPFSDDLKFFRSNSVFLPWNLPANGKLPC